MSTGDIPMCPICRRYMYPQETHSHTAAEMCPFFSRVAELSQKPLEDIMNRRKEGPTGMVLD